MQKSRNFRWGAGALLTATITASTFLLGTFLPNTEWVTPSQARLWTCVGTAILCIGIPVTWYLWCKSKRYGIIETRQLIQPIPDLMGNMHEKRGLFTEGYVRDAVQSNELNPLESLSKGLYQIWGGATTKHN